MTTLSKFGHSGLGDCGTLGSAWITVTWPSSCAAVALLLGFDADALPSCTEMVAIGKNSEGF